MASPVEIEVILYYHTSPAKHPKHDAPAVKDAREFYLFQGMIKPEPGNGEGCFGTTEKGRMYVLMLCDTPFPVTKHVDPRKDK